MKSIKTQNGDYIISDNCKDSNTESDWTPEEVKQVCDLLKEGINSKVLEAMR